MKDEHQAYPKKQFYSISEVAEIVGTNESTLRFWEREFKEIKPRRASRGVRLYSNADLQIVKLVFHLVKEKGLTLDGAKKRLKENSTKESNTMSVINTLKGIRTELLAIRNYMDFLETEEKERTLQTKQKKEEKIEQPTYTQEIEEPENELLVEDPIFEANEEQEEPKAPQTLSLF
jgi:DNA-binding transcriptional MerR regulator